ncbi:MAG: YbjN domain-containing protein [Alphaproteobacteria bacterium]|nr:YbjN domain-containing protein [Alphaproteobacteria bacterium]
MEYVAGSRVEIVHNPVDLIEEIATANEWPFERGGDDELVAQLHGRWDEYRVHFAWNSEISALQFTCALDFKVPNHRRGSVLELVALANERMWLGHFDLTSDEGVAMFRHAVPLRGARGMTVEQVEDMIEVALTECERFFPAFQYVIWGGKDPTEAVAAACIDPVGEA